MDATPQINEILAEFPDSSNSSDAETGGTRGNKSSSAPSVVVVDDSEGEEKSANKSDNKANKTLVAATATRPSTVVTKERSTRSLPKRGIVVNLPLSKLDSGTVVGDTADTLSTASSQGSVEDERRRRSTRRTSPDVEIIGCDKEPPRHAAAHLQRVVSIDSAPSETASAISGVYASQ